MATPQGTPGTPRVLRAMNDRAALELLVTQGPLTRTQVGELTGLSKPTASQLLNRLETAGLVRTVGSVTGRPGPSAQLYEVNPISAHVAALSADPAGVTAVIADVTGRTVGQHRTEGREVADQPPHRAAHLVSSAVDGALEAAGLARADLHGTVIGTPGAFDSGTGELRYAPHLPGWHARTLHGELVEMLGAPVVIENDVNLAALAEQRHGVARDHDTFVLLWLDEGVGAAIVLGGTLLRGATGGAGEVGYMPVPGAPLPRDTSGSTPAGDGGGGFQNMVAVPAVLAFARQCGVTGDSVSDALRDVGVRGALARRLASGIAAIVAVVDPELVVLAGRVAQAGGEPLRELVAEELTGLALPRPALRISDIAGNPILAGALQTALADAQDAVFNTS